MKAITRIQLSVMMFLEFFIWGAWTVPLGGYLGKVWVHADKDIDIGSAYGTSAIAALISPFFVGMIADRFFSAEKVLGILHIMGGIVLIWIAHVSAPGMFFWALLLYMICYMPTLALTNAVAMEQMKDPSKEFPLIRVLGTIGWIVAGFIVSFWKVDMTAGSWSLGPLTIDISHLKKLITPEMTAAGSRIGIEATAIPFIMAGVASVLMGIFCFLLPNTPPKSKGQKATISDILCLDAIKLLRKPSFAVFVLSSVLICIPLAFYYNFTNLFLSECGVNNPSAKMTMGQISETVFMIIMPLFFVRLGVKKMLLIGMLAWTARYVLFAFGNSGPLISMYYAGLLLHGICYDFFFVTGQIYVDREAPKDVRASAQGFLSLVTMGIGMYIGSALLSGRIVGYFKTAEGHNWQHAWLVPAIMAGIVAVIFAVFFHEKKKNNEPTAA
ncbi:MAG: nucleoside permease [Candidatus Sumerlaeota bacterium]|nr:nucleoside permease [Candidatus Sumerlaeota bacterium]